MNAPFYPAEQIDWQDGLNPLAQPSRREQRSPYVYSVLQQPTLVALRNAPGYTLALRNVPAPLYQIVAPRATYDAQIGFPADSWLIGISAHGSATEGFRVQFTQASGAVLFASAPVHCKELDARPYYLPKPQGIVSPYTATVRIINLSATAQFCQVTLWILEPPE